MGIFPTIRVVPFSPLYAATVAGWARGPVDLAWLSPETVPPLSPAKVMAWGGTNRRQFVFCLAPGDTPIGYGELNDMPGRTDQQWIGHLILDPVARGRGVGVGCVQTLLALAFDRFSAAEVLLVVVPDNQAAIRCYERSGLEHVGEEWKRDVQTHQPYRLLRMGIDRRRYEALRRAGQMAALSA